MSKDTGGTNARAPEIGLTLEQLIRRGARDLLQNAIEVKVRELLDEYDNVRTLSGAAAVAHNSYPPARENRSAAGPLEVRVLKVRDRSGAGVTFNSALVPPHARRPKTMSAALSWLYLKGTSPVRHA